MLPAVLVDHSAQSDTRLPNSRDGKIRCLFTYPRRAASVSAGAISSALIVNRGGGEKMARNKRGHSKK